MKISTLFLSFLLCMLVSACVSAQPPATASKYRGVQATQTIEFIVLQNLSTVTVTCSTYAASYDFTDDGTVSGSKCSATGPLLSTPGNSGDITMTFLGLWGTNTVTGCAETEVQLFGDTSSMILQLHFLCI